MGVQQGRGTGKAREICAGTNLSSTSSVYMHLLKLEDEGKIEMKRGNSPRAIRVAGYEYRKMEA